MPTNLCGSLFNNTSDFKIDIKLKLGTITSDIKSIEKDIFIIKSEITEMKCEMRIGMNSLANKLDILLSR